MRETLKRFEERLKLDIEYILPSIKDVCIIYEDWIRYRWVYFWYCKGRSISFIANEELTWKLYDEAYWNPVEYLNLYKELYNHFTNHEVIYRMWYNHCKEWDTEKRIENMSWVYILYDKEEVVYVGQSNNIFLRMNWHRDKEYDSIRFFPHQTKDGRMKHERNLISKLKPKYNIMSK